MCIVCKCKALGDNSELEKLIILDCNNCPFLTAIPVLENLVYLYCKNCPLLTSIPVLNKLVELNCYNCPLLTTIPLLKRLVRLNCADCPIKNIPVLGNLLTLDCSNCYLTTIPTLKDLTQLNCSSCPLLKSIPVLENLCFLWCINCPMLTSITPHPEGGFGLRRLRVINCDDSPFVNHSENKEYKNNLRKIIKCQFYIRRYLNQLHSRTEENIKSEYNPNTDLVRYMKNTLLQTF